MLKKHESGKSREWFQENLMLFYLFSDSWAIRVHSLQTFWLSTAPMKDRNVNWLKTQTKSPTQYGSRIWIHDKTRSLSCISVWKNPIPPSIFLCLVLPSSIWVVRFYFCVSSQQVNGKFIPWCINQWKLQIQQLGEEEGCSVFQEIIEVIPCTKVASKSELWILHFLSQFFF